VKKYYNNREELKIEMKRKNLSQRKGKRDGEDETEMVTKTESKKPSRPQQQISQFIEIICKTM